MGQKVNPHGFRVGIFKDWDSRWFAGKKEYGDLLVEDYNLREFIKKSLYAAGIARIEIERIPEKVRIHIHCAKPGLIIGRGGTEIDKLRANIEKKIGKSVAINIIEIKNMDMSAQLVAEKIAADLENRVSFRRAMKGSIGRTMKSGAKGIKIKCGGRLGGAEIARSECYHEGTIPLQTIRADIDYGFAEANTTYGRIGVKVWIYKGEILTTTLRTTPRVMDMNRRNDRRDRRNDRRNDRRGGYNRDNRQGGYNRDNRGGYNRDNRQGGYNRDNRNAQGARPAQSRPAAPAAPKEGGNA